MKKIVNSMLEADIFSGISEESLTSYMEKIDPKVVRYSKGEQICSPESFVPRIGIIHSGECEVFRAHSENNKVSLRRLARGDVFGVIAVFADKEEFPTVIVARKRSEVIYLNKREVLGLIDSIPDVSKNIILFLAQRIAFLNDKITTFSASTVEEKLASFLLNRAKSEGMSFTINKSKLAEQIGAGRASLYRALSSFIERGIITIENNCLQIIDYYKLERI